MLRAGRFPRRLQPELAKAIPPNVPVAKVGLSVKTGRMGSGGGGFHRELKT
jgi:hypothetical protein